MICKSTLIAIAAIATFASALPAAAMSWAEADATCKPGCAVAGEDGQPKMTGGALHCSGAIVAQNPGTGLTIADRMKLAKDTAKIKMIPVPKALLQPVNK